MEGEQKHAGKGEFYINGNRVASIDAFDSTLKAKPLSAGFVENKSCENENKAESEDKE